MKYTRLIATGAVASAVALAGCGSGHTVTASPQAKQEAKAEYTKFEKVAQQCLPKKDGAPNPLLLRSKASRTQFENCAVPPKQRAHFRICLSNGVFHGLPTRKHLESVAETCINEVQ